MLERLFAQRVGSVPRSFIREILKVTSQPNVISFAGGLPNPELFPVEEFRESANRILSNHGQAALQYTTTEGYPPLRRFIAERYREKKGLIVRPEDILITTGSQEGLDLAGKVFLDREDVVLLERPSYLGAIQAFSAYQPSFAAVELDEDGINISALERELDSRPTKLFYTVPNFQNPSGITYSREKRESFARVMSSRNTAVIEDDPYGELRFLGSDLPNLKNLLPESCILLGSFSKIVSPGIRIGWMVAPESAMRALVTFKQGTDLHTGNLDQRILFDYLSHTDLDAHIDKIRAAYRIQRDAMVTLLEAHCPEGVTFTRPEGGMFVWVTLPENASAMELFERAIKEQVAFVPGDAFHIGGSGKNSLRLNFSSTSPDRIETGLVKLTRVMKDYLAEIGKP
ncbi:MAG TPA: PLP-dependent aminotransferase family protein [Spirochaetia bacterium]|nr:PLP-dependent aminotransferase family protein [Spirochaetia bacterium]